MKTVVITGASSGIGLCLAQQYLAQGDKVIGVCRKVTPELSNLDVTVIDGIDVTDESALQSLGQQLANEKIDVLINNAGMFANEHFGDIDFEQINKQLQVNAIAPLRVTELLRPYLNSSAKLAFITSRMGSIADNGSGAYYGYRMSKAALNAGAVSLARDLQDDGIAVAILHPGMVQTKMIGFAGDVSPETAAERLKQRIDELTLNTSGTFWHANGEVLPW